jgi:hypothetical protein
MKKKGSQIKDIAMSGVDHLNAAHADMLLAIETDAHSWSVWMKILQYLQIMHFLVWIMFFEVAP